MPMPKHQNLVQFDLNDGLEFFKQTGRNKSALVRLFEKYHSRGYEFCCWCCGIQANAFIVREHAKKGEEDEIVLVHVDKCKQYHPFTKDHIIPVAWGGKNHENNYRPACQYCNNRRGIRMTWDEVLFAQQMYNVNLSKDEIETQVHIVPYHAYKGKKDTTVRINRPWKDVLLEINRDLNEVAYV